jgi:hypothetical protein
VKSQNTLGIYISKDKATAVCVSSKAKTIKVHGSFTVTAPQGQAERPVIQTLAELLAQGCKERKWSFAEAAVALDCAMFMQHSLHSEFNDPKQIASTIRFDTEEALATDITEFALAFDIISGDKTGSQLTVFTAHRKILSEVILALQQNNIDPVTIEPDIMSLARFISYGKSSGTIKPADFYGILSTKNGYLIRPSPGTDTPSCKSLTARTFLVGQKQNRTDLLAREMLMTISTGGSKEPVKSLGIFDSQNSIDSVALGGKLGIEPDSTCNLQFTIESAKSSKEQSPAGITGSPNDAIAYGAAIAHLDKSASTNFRNDFSPFQGKKMRLQNAVKFASVTLTVLVLAVGLLFHLHLYLNNRDIKNLRDEFAKQYFSVMMKKLAPDKTTKDAVDALKREYQRLEDEKQGRITEGQSISAKLTLLLTAINKCAAKTDLHLKEITLSPTTIHISGDTSSRNNTSTVFQVMRDSGLEIPNPDLSTQGNRDVFNINVIPRKTQTASANTTPDTQDKPSEEPKEK